MKLNYIDSIRGVAILMVIMVHASQTVQGLGMILSKITYYGQMGVQLFFVASSYTLCLSFANRGEEINALKKYTVRRYFRIAPAYYIGIAGYFFFLVMLAVANHEVPVVPADYTVANVLSNFLFVHGFFPPGNNNIVPGGWSIGTEMAFYAVFPFLFSRARRLSSANLKNVWWFPLIAICASQLLLLLIYVTSGHYVKSNNFLYFNLINQLPVFAIGITYFMLERNNMLKTSWRQDLLLFIFLTYLSITLFKYNWNYFYTIIPIVSALSFVFLIELFKKIRQLNLKILERIGTVSYSMYLIHYVFAHYISLRLAPVLANYFNSYCTFFILFTMSVVASFLLGCVSEKYIEQPFIQRGKEIVKKLDRS
ncbi:MAG: acyltransferase [Chitinophagaceae bacterium]